MFCVDKCGFTAAFLRFRNDVQRKRCFTGGFRPVDFNDASARNAADAQRQIQRKGAGRDAVNVHHGVVAKAHNAAFAVCLFDLCERCLKRFLFIGIHN